MQSGEHKIIFTGTMGAGKTTAIAAVSDVPVISTDVRNTDRSPRAKSTTTVAMDYGELLLDDGTALRLYGTPGQERFKFMWGILAKGALGLVVLTDNSRPDPLADLDLYLENFDPLVRASTAVVGVGRSERHAAPSVDSYHERLSGRNLFLPVLAVDVRRRDDVLLLLDALLSVLESNAA